MLIVAGVGSLIVAYSVGYMDGDDEERRYFAYMSLFVFSMLLLVAGRQPAAAARRLGHGRPLELPADRLPPGSAVRDRRREEGVRDERVRRRDDGARALPADPAHGPARLRRRLRRVAARRRGREPDRARPARRRRREERADPAAHVAPGRDGRPDAGQRADPRGDDGDRRRLPDRPLPPAVRERVRDPGPRGRARRGDAADGRADRARADRHQARDRVLDDVADRLHVRRRRARRVPERDVPPDDARVLQGAALPGGRPRDPRGRRRAGHPQARRRRQADAVHEGRRS